MAVKAPEKLLGVMELVALTGFNKQTVTKLFKTVWNVPGGAKFILGQYKLPVSFYNRWVDGQGTALGAKEKEARDA